MKVLFVAPEIPGLPKLETWSEIGQIGDMAGVTLDVLIGKNVTRARVANKLKQPREVIILAGHGEEGRFAVSDGWLTARWLAQYVKQAEPDVVLLAFCYSAGAGKTTLTSMAEEISGAGISVIAMPTAVDDDAAVIYDIELVRAFSNGAGLRKAHQIAQEQMETLTDARHMPLFLPGLNADVAGSLGRVVDEVASLGKQIADLVQRVDSVFFEQGRQAVRIGRVEEKITTLINGGGRQ